MLTTVSHMFGPDFTTEGTEITETDRKERRVRTRIRPPFSFPASVDSVASVVKRRIAPMHASALVAAPAHPLLQPFCGKLTAKP